MTAPVERSGRRELLVLDGPPAVVLLLAGKAVEVGVDRLLAEQLPHRADCG